MRVLIAPDKFKGSLTASAAASAMADGWRDAWPEAEITLRPVADGGEGTADVLCESLGGQWVELGAHDPLGRALTARYAILRSPDPSERSVALIATSAASGYLLVKPAERDLPRSSTYGTGELLRHALGRTDVGRVVMGLGGSATNDGGMGLAAAIGYQFLDAAGRSLGPLPENLGKLARIVPPADQPWHTRPVVAACDVQNPLLGPRGATHVYGPQKGLTSAQEPLLETGLRRLADVVAESLGVDFRDAPGAGAAGGLGFGLLSFCNARLEPGFTMVAGLLGLEQSIREADVVLTGEGAADAQSLEGKAPHGVASMARRLGKPVILFAGVVPPEDQTALREYFDRVHALADGSRTVEECIGHAGPVLRQVVAGAARGWPFDRNSD